MTPDPPALEAHGFHVFPILPGKKVPAVKHWNDPQAQWSFSEADNIGIFTGAFRHGGALLVVDVDNKGGKHGDATVLALEIAGKPFPRTLEAITPTGGRHLYYRVADAVRSGVEVLGPGLDIRSAGGYVVAPGSRVHLVSDGAAPVVGVYTFAEPLAELAWAPEWLVEACGKPRERTAESATPLPGVDPDRARERARAVLDATDGAVQGTGGDDFTFRVACAVKDTGVDEATCLELMLDWNERCEPPWTPEELATKVHNAYSYGQNSPGVSAPEAIFGPVTSGDAGAAATVDARHRLEPYVLRKASELFGDPDPEWLIDELFPARGLAIVYGEPSAGKSFLALDLAAAIARGVPWGGREVKVGTVVYSSLEGQQKMRVEAYVRHHKLDRTDLDRVYFVEQQPLNLLDPTCKPALALIEAIQSVADNPRAVIIDTLARAMPGGNENASEDMGRAIDVATHIAHALTCLVVLVHHSGKDASQGARGHSSLHGAADAELHVTYDRDAGLRHVRIAKLKDGDDQGRWSFQLEKVGLGTGPRGNNRHSSVVTGLERAVAPAAKLTAPQLILVEALRLAIAQKEESLTSTGQVFDEAPVSREEWRKAYYVLEDQPETGGSTAKARALKNRFYDGVNALVKKERVGRRGADGFVLLPEEKVEL